MEKFYNAYEKKINDVTFYFVKQYHAFPEYKNVAPILDTYGMHRDFEKACKIAIVDDPEVQQKLAAKLGLFESYHATQKNMPAHYRRPEIFNLRFPEFNFPFLSKLIRIR